MKIGDKVIDLLGDMPGLGEVIEIYVNRHDDPCGTTLLIVRWGEGDEVVDADRLPEEVELAEFPAEA